LSNLVFEACRSCGDLAVVCGFNSVVTADVKRAFKTKVLFRKPEGGIYEMKHRGHIAQAIASIIKTNPNADIL
jgi:hypothetical protein